MGEALVQPCVGSYGVPEDELVVFCLADAPLNGDGQAIFVPCDLGLRVARDNAVQAGGFGQDSVQRLGWGEDFRGTPDV